MTEEERASEYRARCARRRAYTEARLSALGGDPAALAALNARWASLIEELRGTEPPGPLCFPEDPDPQATRPPRILYYA